MKQQSWAHNGTAFGPTEGVFPDTRELFPETICMNVAQQHKVGPLRSTLLNPHGRPIMCMDVKDSMLVTGSMDHGLRVYDINTGNQKRELYTKRYGHKEWVTSVSIGPDRRILSAGMDNRLLYWRPNSTSCDEIPAHTASISKVSINERNMAVSASYDKTLRLWPNLARWKSQKALTLIGHKQAVTSFDWNDSMIVSGDRAGGLKIFDMETGRVKKTIKGHTGAVMNVLLGPSRIFSGCTNGIFQLYDKRKRRVGLKIELTSKRISINDIVLHDKYVITGSSDNIVRIVDLRKIEEGPIVLEGHTDIIARVLASKLSDVCVSCSGNGMVLVHSISSGDLLYGFGAGEGNKAVNTMSWGLNESKLICCGDDAVPNVFSFA